MMRDHVEKTLSDATRRRPSTALAVQLNGQVNGAFLRTVPDAACEALVRRVLRAKEGLMPSSLR